MPAGMSWSTYVAAVLDALGYPVSSSMEVLPHADQPVVECCWQQTVLNQPKLSRLQIFLGNSADQFAEQVMGHMGLAGSGIVTSLTRLLIVPSIPLPVLVYEESRDWPLSELIKSKFGFKCASLVAWDLIQAVRVANCMRKPLGPLSPTRVRVSSDGMFRAKVHLFTTSSHELLRCHPEQIRAALLEGHKVGKAKQQGHARLPVPQSTEFDLWSVGLLLYELILGRDLQEDLTTLLEGDLRPERVAAHYEAYLSLGDPTFSYAEYCYPNLRPLRENQVFRCSVDLMSFCMWPHFFATQFGYPTHPTFSDSFFSRLLGSDFFAAREKFRARWTRADAPLVIQVREADALRKLGNLRRAADLEYTGLRKQLTTSGLHVLSGQIEHVFSRSEAPLSDVVNLVVLLLYPNQRQRARIVHTGNLQQFMHEDTLSKLWLDEQTLYLAFQLLLPRTISAVCDLEDPVPRDLAPLLLGNATSDLPASNYKQMYSQED